MYAIGVPVVPLGDPAIVLRTSTVVRLDCGPLITKTGLVIGINTWGKRNIVKDKSGKGVLDAGASNINFALTMPQMRNEIDKHAKGVSWLPLVE